MENHLHHHGIHADHGVDPMAAPTATIRASLLIALRAATFAAALEVVNIVPGKAMALHVVTDGGALTIINVYGVGSGGDLWAPKPEFGWMWSGLQWPTV